MGGVPPLGYDPHPDPNVRELVVNAPEAVTVKELFELYVELGCLVAVELETNRRELRSKLHHFSGWQSLQPAGAHYQGGQSSALG